MRAAHWPVPAANTHVWLAGPMQLAWAQDDKARRKAGQEEGCSLPRESWSIHRQRPHQGSESWKQTHPSRSPPQGRSQPTGQPARCPDSQICGLQPGEGNWAKKKEKTQHKSSISGYPRPQVERVRETEVQLQLPREKTVPICYCWGASWATLLSVLEGVKFCKEKPTFNFREPK